MTRKTLALAVAAAAAGNGYAAPSADEMWQIIQQQQKEIQSLRQQVKQTGNRLEKTDVKVEATAEALEARAGEGQGTAGWASNTTIGGYGELHYNHFEDRDDRVDAHRFVLFVGHQFSDTVRFFSEVELEHGFVEGGEDSGEVELEQAYIEWDFAEGHSVQIGQFLLPVGLINETHEPDTFYGVERNRVEAQIIPATWWETGVKFSGEIVPGFSYAAAIHSGLNIPDNFSVRSGRQKSSNADAEDLAFTGRLKYTGIAGLEVAASYQWQQDVTQGNTVGVEGGEGTLIEVHGKYQTGPLTLTALWAGWDIDSDAFKAVGADQQEGYYVEASYLVTEKLGVFVRQSQYNTRAGDSNSTDSEYVDYGLNYWLQPNVVLKADYTDELTDNTGTGGDSDAFNLGVGWSF